MEDDKTRAGSQSCGSRCLVTQGIRVLDPEDFPTISRALLPFPTIDDTRMSLIMTDSSVPPSASNAAHLDQRPHRPLNPQRGRSAWASTVVSETTPPHRGHSGVRIPPRTRRSTGSNIPPDWSASGFEISSTAAR